MGKTENKSTFNFFTWVEVELAETATCQCVKSVRLQLGICPLKATKLQCQNHRGFDKGRSLMAI